MSSTVGACRHATNSSDGKLIKLTNFQQLLRDVLMKLQNDPLAITAEDARRLHEHFDAVDDRSARIISAVEALAVANQDLCIEKGDTALHQAGHASILTLLEDLLAAVDANPGDVTPEMLRLAQVVVNKCQKAISHTNAPHPKLEAELQEEFTKIAPKVEAGTVTKEEASHLHSLEARAYGHTERGGLTATAQSVVAKRERKASLSETIHQEVVALDINT